MEAFRIILAVTLLTVSTLHSQIVADGATNTLSNVTTNITGDVTVGTNGSFTLVVLSNNALLTNSVRGLIGHNVTAKSNEVRLVSASARWLMGGDLNVGQNGAFNRLVVSNGGIVSNATGTIGSESVSVPVANSKGLTLYDDRSDCPCVVIHPRLFFKRIKTEFEDYFDCLLDPDPKWTTLRTNFKRKFLVSYGIDIGSEP